MAAFPITTTVNIDSLTGKAGNDSYSINGGRLIIDGDSRYDQNATQVTGVMGPMTGSAVLGGDIIFDARKVRIIPFSTGSGTVPAYGTTISRGSASGVLLSVYSAIGQAPTLPGATMPTSGFIKIKQWNSTEYTAGALTGISATATGASRVGWIEVVAREGVVLALNRLNNQTSNVFYGDDFIIGTTGGSRSDTYQAPYQGYDLYLPAFKVLNPAAGTISAMSYSNGTVTSTSTAHGLATGDTINITGAANEAYNVTNRIVTKINANSFSFRFKENPGVYVSGASFKGRDDWYPVVPSSTTATPDLVETNPVQGKVCWYDPTTGVMRFGNDGTNSTGGYLPPAGRTIVIPNLILQSATVANANNLHFTIGTRVRITTTTANFFVDHVSSAWTFYVLTGSPQAVEITNSAIIAGIGVTNCATRVKFNRSCVATPLSGSTASMALTSLPLGFEMIDSVIHKGDLNTDSGSMVKLTSVIGTNISGSRVQGTNKLPRSTYGFYSNLCDLISISDSTFLPYFYTSQTTNVKYTDIILNASGGNTSGVTWFTNAFNIINKSSGFVINGVDTGGLPRLLARGVILLVSLSSYNIKLYNVGRYEDPIIAGGPKIYGASCTRVNALATVTEVGHPYQVGEYINVFQTEDVNVIIGAKTVTAVTADTFSFVAKSTGTVISEVSYYQSYGRHLADLATDSYDIDIRNVHWVGNMYGLSTNNTVSGLKMTNTSSDMLATAVGYNANDSTFKSVMNPPLNPIGMAGQYGQSFVDEFNMDVATIPYVTGKAWTRNSAAYTVTSPNHGLITGQRIMTWNATNPVGVPSVTKAVTVITKDTFYFTGVSSGASSGTLDYGVPHGRLILYMNENSANTSRYTIDAGTPAFTGTGFLFAPTVGDQVTWETPRFLIGHDAFAPHKIQTNTLDTNARNGVPIGIDVFDQTYDIDTGSGFTETYKNLWYPTLLGGGAVGSTTVTMSDTTGVAVDDYVYGNGIAYMAQVVSITNGTTIEVSLPNTDPVTASLFFSAIPNEVIGDDGFRLKWRLRVNRNNSTSLNHLVLPMLDTHTSRARTYPIPVLLTTQSVEVTNGVPGSRIQIYDLSSETELVNEIVTTFRFRWTDPNAYSADREIRVRAAYVNGLTAKTFVDSIIGVATNDEPAVSVRLNQVDDLVYNLNAIDGSTVTGLVIDGFEGLFKLSRTASIQEMYNYSMYTLFTAIGIAQYGQKLFATDRANYVLHDRKIKNVSSPSVPISITGGWTVDSVTGLAATLFDQTGGSLFNAPDHIVPFASGSGVTPGDIVAITSAVWADTSTYSGTAKGKVLVDGADSAELASIR